VARSCLSRLLAQRKIEKTYLALVTGEPAEEEGVIDLPIEKGRKGTFRIAPPGEGHPCLTKYRVFARRGQYSLLEIRPQTGRTHQIRVHLAAIGCPLVLDPLYGLVKAKPSERPNLTLHAWKLSFPHPMKQGKLDIESPFPEWSKPHWISF
jgi:23S rRNA pseudouridine1911/1915/1917 synthase